MGVCAQGGYFSQISSILYSISEKVHDWTRGPNGLRYSGPKGTNREICNPDSTQHLLVSSAFVGPIVPFQNLPSCRDFLKTMWSKLYSWRRHSVKLKQFYQKQYQHRNPPPDTPYTIFQPAEIKIKS